jgi:ribosomal-protein-alanine N-acetyltransferase
MIGWLNSLFAAAEPALGEAAVADARAFAAMHAGAFQRGWSEEELERLLIDRNVIAHRARLKQALAGFILSRRAADEAEILSVVTGPRARGRGIGRRLLDFHLRRLLGAGVRTVFLEVDEHNTAARRLYARAGFHEVARRAAYYPGPSGEPSAAIVLRRDLA